VKLKVCGLKPKNIGVPFAEKLKLSGMARMAGMGHDKKVSFPKTIWQILFWEEKEGKDKPGKKVLLWPLAIAFLSGRSQK
jgi:hypothetical protein